MAKHTYQAEVILDDHDISHLEVGVQATGSVRDDQKLDTHQAHHTDRKSDLVHRVALIVVESAAHANALNATNSSEHQLTSVTSDSGTGEAGDILVLEGNGRLQTVTQTGQARSADNSHLRSVSGIRLKETGNLFVSVSHGFDGWKMKVCEAVPQPTTATEAPKLLHFYV
jgi:hypothetical protein